MPRSSTGSYSLPSGSIVASGDTILASQHNPPLQDLAQSMGNSLDRDGKGGMRANLAMGGNSITGLADGVNPTDAATVGQIAAGEGMPIGVVLDYWGTVPPDGWLFAAGQAVSRTTYAALFAIIGTAGGSGDGSTTFNLPDYRGRVPAGKENMATPSTARLDSLSSSTLGAVGGAQTATLTTSQIPAHSHALSGNTASSGSHTHTIDAESTLLVNPGTEESAIQLGTAGVSTSSNGAHTHALSGDTASAGGGEAHSNVQPTIICNKIIKAA